MSWKDIIGKIHYDLVDDTANYNHSVPLLLLLIEFPVNNIVFTRKMLSIAFVINTVYILVNYAYCMTKKVEVYDCLDWVNHPINSFVGAELCQIVTLLFYLGINRLNKIKFSINGMSTIANAL